MSDSQIIKAALLLAQPDKRLLTAHREIKGADQRYKQEPKEEQVCGGRCQPNGSVVSGLRLFVAYVVIRLLLQTGQLVLTKDRRLRLHPSRVALHYEPGRSKSRDRD